MIAAVPTVALELDGVPVAAADLRSLTAVSVMQRLSQPTLCELVFSDPPGPLDMAARVPPGTSLAVSVAVHGGELFSGEVTARELHHAAGGERTVRLRAYDALHHLRLSQHVRSFSQMNPSEVARELLGPLGVEVDAAISGPLHEHIVQFQQSDLELLQSLLAGAGLFVTMRGSRAQIFDAAGAGTATSLTVGENLIDAWVGVNSVTGADVVEARGWHPLTVTPLEVRVAGVGLDQSATAPIDARSGAGQPTRLLSGSVAQSGAQLEAAARAKLERYRAARTSFAGLAIGDPKMRPGAKVDVIGLPADVSGSYVLTAVEHLIDQHRGYLCELSTIPAAPQEPREGCHPTLGIVSNVSDPEKRGRVRVELPALGELESGWLQVLAAGAGAGKGLTVLPGVGDSVLVLLPLDDPSQGIVLGGLFGEPGTVDPGVTAGQVRRYSFRSPAGQLVVLDDEAGTLSLDDGQGSRVELSPRRVRIASASELELEAVAGVRIKGRTVDFERA